jgi:hypothetical protein
VLGFELRNERSEVLVVHKPLPSTPDEQRLQTRLPRDVDASNPTVSRPRANTSHPDSTSDDSPRLEGVAAAGFPRHPSYTGTDPDPPAFQTRPDQDRSTSVAGGFEPYSAGTQF